MGSLEEAVGAKRLEWYGKGLDDEDAKVVAYVVAASGSMAILVLTDNSIGDVGAKAIAEAVRSSGSMAVLGLSHNQIGNEGAKAIGGALAVNAVLTKLNLDGRASEPIGLCDGQVPLAELDLQSPQAAGQLLDVEGALGARIEHLEGREQRDVVPHEDVAEGRRDGDGQLLRTQRGGVHRLRRRRDASDVLAAGDEKLVAILVPGTKRESRARRRRGHDVSG